MVRFKVCCCCKTQVGIRKRVCPSCKVPALWREPTEAEQIARDDHERQVQATFDSLMRR